MFAIILAALSFIIALFGLYAFVQIIMTEKPSKISVMDLQEFDGLPEDIRKLYQKTVIDIIIPAVNRVAVKEYEKLLKATTYDELEKGSIVAAKTFAATIEKMDEPTKESFVSYMRKTNFIGAIPRSAAF